MAADSSSASAMIDITVKTLDGQNRTFTVPENINVHQFKDKIAGSIGICASLQRLIFQGKVMQDEKILREYDIHGKVIHVVQRPPPSTVLSTATTTSSPTTSNPPGRAHGQADMFDVQIHLGRVNQVTPNSREARARIRQADFNLGLINDLLNQLENQTGSNASEETIATSALNAGSQPENMDTSESPTTESSDAQRPAETSPSNGEGVLLATELADFLERLLITNERMAPHIRRYRDYLRSEESFAESSSEALNAQDIVNRVSEALHAMSHVFHSISDVTVDVTANPPRQGVANPPAPFNIPGTTSMAIPIHMNVRARPNGNGNRPRQEPAAATTTPVTQSTSTSTTPSVTVTGGRNTIPEINSISIPLPSNTTGDSAMMVEVFPTGVTVHDIRAVVTQEIVDTQDSVNDTGSGPSNITVVSAATIDPVLVTATPTPGQASTPSSSVPPPSPPSTPRTAEAASTTTTTSSSTSSFTFSPTTSVNIAGGTPTIGIGQVPNLPGLPTGMLQNILGSILNSHGVRPGQPFQVNVHQVTPTPGMLGSRLPGRQQRPPQQSAEIPLDGDVHFGEGLTHPSNQNTADTQTSASFMDAPQSARCDASTSTSQSHISSSNPESNTTGNTSTNATFNFTAGSRDSSPFHRTGHRRTNVSQNLTRPNMGRGRGRGSVPSVHRPQPSVVMRPPGSNPFSRGYVDPYLPCVSNHYSSELARNAFRNIQAQMQSRGQPAQQVPNLSTMVSGMVGEILEHVGQAQQALNNSNRTSTSASPPSATPSGNTAGAGNQRDLGALPFNPMDILSGIINSDVTSRPPGAVPFDFGSFFSNILNQQAPSDRNTQAPPGTLAQLFTSIRSATGETGDENNVILGLIEAIAPHMRLNDLFQLVTGDTQVLPRLRAPLRDFVRSKITQHGSLDRVVEVTLDDMNNEICFMQGLVEVRSGVDMAASMRNCLKTHLVNLFTVVNSDIPDDRFGPQLYELWMRMMAETIALCVYCIRDGQTGFSNMVQRYMPRMTQEMNPQITSWMTSSLRDILRSFYNNHPVPESNILPFVVQPSQRSEEANTVRSTSKEPSNLTKTPSTSHTHSTSCTQVAASPSPQPPKAKVPRTDSGNAHELNEVFLDAQESLPPAPRSRPTTFKSSSQSPTGAVGGSPRVINRSSDDWQSVIPQEWIPVISQDIVRQQEQRPQPPLSDVYLQGLPAKRRRMMTLEHASEMGNMPQYFPASLARAARAAGVEPISSEENLIHEATANHDLQAELEREVAAVIEARVSSDRDYNPERFPNTKEYFHNYK